jgi:type III secretion protein U
MAEKTEKATPKKLRDARKKGQVAKSQDFPSACTFIVSIMVTLYFAHYLFETLGAFIIEMFKFATAPGTNVAKQGGTLILMCLEIIAKSTLPILIAVVIVGVVVNFLVVGPMFSMEAMKFAFKKLNPVEGIKQKFKLKVLVELIKSILKIVGAAIIIFLAMWSMVAQAATASAIPVIGSALILDDFLTTIAIRVGIFF